MVYSQSPPLVEKEWLTAEETSSGVRARDLDARSDQRIGIRPKKPSIHSPHSSSLKDDQVASGRPTIGRRIFRTLTPVFIAVRSLQPGLASREIAFSGGSCELPNSNRRSKCAIPPCPPRAAIGGCCHQRYSDRA